MKHISTEIEINAPAETVWTIFTDFDKYPEWNPFIKSVEGEVKQGMVFKVKLQQPDSKPMLFKPRCLKLDTKTRKGFELMNEKLKELAENSQS